MSGTRLAAGRNSPHPHALPQGPPRLVSAPAYPRFS
jgi:hypothetical protein